MFGVFCEKFCIFSFSRNDLLYYYILFLSNFFVIFIMEYMQHAYVTKFSDSQRSFIRVTFEINCNFIKKKNR